MSQNLYTQQRAQNLFFPLLTLIGLMHGPVLLRRRYLITLLLSTVPAGALSLYQHKNLHVRSTRGLIPGPRPAGHPAGPAARGGKTDGRPTGTEPRTVAAINCRSFINARLNAEQLTFPVCCQLAGGVEHSLLTADCACCKSLSGLV